MSLRQLIRKLVSIVCGTDPLDKARYMIDDGISEYEETTTVNSRSYRVAESKTRILAAGVKSLLAVMLAFTVCAILLRVFGMWPFSSADAPTTTIRSFPSVDASPPKPSRSLVPASSKGLVPATSQLVQIDRTVAQAGTNANPSSSMRHEQRFANEPARGRDRGSPRLPGRSEFGNQSTSDCPTDAHADSTARGRLRSYSSGSTSNEPPNDGELLSAPPDNQNTRYARDFERLRREQDSVLNATTERPNKGEQLRVTPDDQNAHYTRDFERLRREQSRDE